MSDTEANEILQEWLVLWGVAADKKMALSIARREYTAAVKAAAATFKRACEARIKP